FVLAAPTLNDVHKTSLELFQLGNLPTVNRFAVRVRRVDDVLDDKAENAVVAERISQVFLTFDVSPAAEVTVNGASVPMGISRLQIEAGIVVGVSEETAAKIPKEELAKAFDIGLVNVLVHVSGEKTLVDGVEVTRILIAERILEMNGDKLKESDIIQQVFIINDGSVSALMPCHADQDVETLLFSAEVGDENECMSKWGWLLAKFSLIGMFLVGAGIFHTFKKKTVEEDEDEDESLQKVVLDSENLPKYTPVAEDEKV
ncbi:hypothetical protein HK096_009059, partial [Nowakowskiella sp. JEL0078]